MFTKFSVYVTEARPTTKGERAVKYLQSMKIQASLILDSAVGYFMEKVDAELVGAEGVVEKLTGELSIRLGPIRYLLLPVQPISLCMQLQSLSSLFAFSPSTSMICPVTFQLQFSQRISLFIQYYWLQIIHHHCCNLQGILRGIALRSLIHL